MRNRFRRGLLLGLALVLAAVSAPSWRTAASDLASPYTGYGLIEGPFQIEVFVSPPVIMPGQTLTLDLKLRNISGSAATPALIIGLPQGTSLDRNLLPAGTTLNLQTGELNWLPTASQTGSVQQMSAELRVETAVIDDPEQEITVSVKIEGEEATVSIPIWIGIAPQINEILNPPQVAVGQPIQLRAEIDGSGPLTYSWALGDGRLVEVEAPQVVYPAPGIYRVRLEVSNPLTTVSIERPVTVVPHPAAQFTVDDLTAGVGQTIHFINQSGGQLPLAFAWDFGDGTTSDLAAPEHQYSAPGTYQVRLAVENDYGLSEAFWTLSVGLPPGADMTIADSVPSGVKVVGQASGDETVKLFAWNMGDGRTYEGPTISHVYRRMGDFYVSMTASNEFGSMEIGRWIQVTNGISWLYLPAVLNTGLLDDSLIQDASADPLGLDLEPVDLDEPFVMEPLPEGEGLGQTEQLLLYINEARRQFDLPPLLAVPQLSQAAGEHTSDMAAFRYTAHAGSDGSFPVERLLWHGYPSGYAGEATAWGFQYAYQAVEFWVNSPAHRRIILNRYATDVGTGFTVDYNAPNVWYWTAEFGNAGVPAAPPVLRLNGPGAASLVDLSDPELQAQLPMITDPVAYSWNWPLPLDESQQFVLYLYVGGEARPLAIVPQPWLGNRYVAESPAFPTALDYQSEIGLFEWQVKLEDRVGRVMVESERRTIVLAPDLSLPSPLPEVTATPLPTATPSPTPLVTPTPTAIAPAPTARPAEPTPPVFITATPVLAP